MIVISPSGARVIKYDPQKKENCMIVIKYDVILAIIVIIGRVAPLLSVVLLLSFNSLFFEGLSLLTCYLARGGGGAALGPWPPAFWLAPCAGKARHSWGQLGVAGRNMQATGVLTFRQENVVLFT